MINMLIYNDNAIEYQAIRTHQEIEESESEQRYFGNSNNNNDRYVVVQIELLKPKDCFVSRRRYPLLIVLCK